MGSLNPAFGFLKEGTSVPAEHSQAPLPPLALSKNSCPAVTCSEQQPLYSLDMINMAVSGEGYEQPLAHLMLLLDSR